MKLIKKNLKLIVGILIGMLLVSGVTAYATYKYYATDVSYTKNGKEMSVAEALNELYEIKKDYIKSPNGTMTITKNGDYDVTNISKAIVNVPIPDNYIEKPTKTLDITENNKTYNVTDYANVFVNLQSLEFEKQVFIFPERGTTFSINLGVVPEALVMVTENTNKVTTYWGSFDSLKTFYNLSTSTKSNYFRLEGKNLIVTDWADTLVGGTITLYTIK